MVRLKQKNIIGQRIKYLRINKKITQEQLTARLNIQGIEIDRPMISRIESQTRNLLDYEIKAIANALNVSIEDLFKKNI
ncbi:helix-turn-helix transcriptional regulator [Clostridium sp. 19966]|uniref:helix-turn-helix domain-containing protein n=1 Tax=Clostridium sp. 19966 TaxID=2768166 RepID=UPI0028DFCA8B|nr:helix-turn-helix transcriptional regulator [Clostridium sp. 19966]MDT8718883.1 helix-turn-helix transcriptional regulator [Clostridium sp. 19966]